MDRSSSSPSQLDDCCNVLLVLVALGGNVGGGRPGVFPNSCVVLGLRSDDVDVLGGSAGGDRGGRSSILLSFGGRSSILSFGVPGFGGNGGWEDKGEVGSLPPLFFWASGSASSSIESCGTFGRCCLRPGRVRNPLWSGPLRSIFHLLC